MGSPAPPPRHRRATRGPRYSPRDRGSRARGGPRSDCDEACGTGAARRVALAQWNPHLRQPRKTRSVAQAAARGLCGGRRGSPGPSRRRGSPTRHAARGRRSASSGRPRRRLGPPAPRQRRGSRRPESAGGRRIDSDVPPRCARGRARARHGGRGIGGRRRVDRHRDEGPVGAGVRVVAPDRFGVGLEAPIVRSFRGRCARRLAAASHGEDRDREDDEAIQDANLTGAAARTGTASRFRLTLRSPPWRNSLAMSCGLLGRRYPRFGGPSTYATTSPSMTFSRSKAPLPPRTPRERDGSRSSGSTGFATA